MNEIFSLVIALAAGVLLGSIFFGGLQWTIWKGRVSKRPASLFFCSLLLRTSVALTGFYFLGRGHWERMIVCLLGFVIARLILTWLILNHSGVKSTRAEQEAGHAT